MAETTVPSNAPNEQVAARLRLIGPYPQLESKRVHARNASIVDEWVLLGASHVELAAKHGVTPAYVLDLLARCRRRSSRIPGRNLAVYEDWLAKRLGLKGLMLKYDLSAGAIRVILRDHHRRPRG